MRLEEFDYGLPPELIAQTPVEPRDSARLLVDAGNRRLPLHRRVSDFSDYCQSGDVVVVNDTKVIPARIHLQRQSGGAVEVLLLEQVDSKNHIWEALLRPAKRLRVGETLHATNGTPVAQVGSRSVAGDTFYVNLLVPSNGDLSSFLGQYGQMPLPPYITTPLIDSSRYQTIYANTPTSAAAPTAGLHFTDEVLDRLAAKGVKLLTVELTVGLDTFAPVTQSNPLDHKMHTEAYSVSAETLATCRQAKRVIAIGTTATRALESAATTGVLSGRTNIFISRGYEFKVVDLLLTNFHMPRTTLLMLIEAFIGSRWRDLYMHAISEKYRMLSFGDAMLLDRSLNLSGDIVGDNG